MSKLPLWAKAGALTLFSYGVWKALSFLLAILNPRRIRCWFSDGQARDQVISKSAALQEGWRELEALGFRLLGVKHEKLPLGGRHAWELSTVSPIAEAFASIVLKGNGEPFIIYFYTPLLEGGLVYTRQRSTFLGELESRNTSIKNIDSTNLGDLLASHRERLAAFKQKGFHPLLVDSQGGRIEATYAFYTSGYAKKIMASSALFNLLFYLMLALFLLFGRW